MFKFKVLAFKNGKKEYEYLFKTEEEAIAKVEKMKSMKKYSVNSLVFYEPYDKEADIKKLRESLESMENEMENKKKQKLKELEQN